MSTSLRPPCLGIELRHVAALAAVSREGSFNAAAASLGYVQSAISQQVAQLERVLGTRLVERRRGIAAVGLTPAGELLLEHFEKILARLVAAQADLDALAAGRVGRLRVGVDESAATRLMPPVLRALANHLPQLEVEMEESRSGADLARLVEAGELDLAFGYLPLAAGPFELRELMYDRYVLLAPAGWELVEMLDTAQLAARPLIGWGDEHDARQIEQALRAHGLEPRFVCRSGINTAVQAMVGAGIGAAIVPRLAVNPSDERSVALDLGDLLPPRAIALYWHREPRRPPAIAAFVNAAVAAMPEILTETPKPALAV